jgi:hypothetical protein
VHFRLDGFSTHVPPNRRMRERWRGARAARVLRRAFDQKTPREAKGRARAARRGPGEPPESRW